MAEDSTNKDVETADTAESKSPNLSSPSTSPPTTQTKSVEAEPEAHIVEETIIKPAAAKKKTPPPMPPKEFVPPAKEKAPIVPNTPAPKAPKPIPTPSALPVVEKPSVTPVTPPLPPPLPPVTGSIEKAQETISNILKEVRLPERHIQNGGAQTPEKLSFDTTIGATADQPQEESFHETAPTTPTAHAEQPSIVSPVRTLKNDLQEIVRVNKMSLVRAAALEQEKRSGNTPSSFQLPQRRSKTMRMMLIAVGAFILLGGAVLFGIYFTSQDQPVSPVHTLDSSILFAENTLLLPLQGGSTFDMKRFVAGTRTGGGATLGSITRFIPTVEHISPETGESTAVPATLEEFLNALGARAPTDLTRALSNEFFFGIHTVDENAPIFVIPVLSYERAFAGMLSWEERMNADLSPTFTLVPTQVLGDSGLPEKRRFEDVVMRNYDVRALKDDAGTIELYYSFPTRSLLVIGESPYSFTEILNRLRAERKL